MNEGRLVPGMGLAMGTNYLLVTDDLAAEDLESHVVLEFLQQQMKNYLEPI